ncbi:MAG: hypothetical protein P4M12_10840 [Gammaproteobacteria bacterium]|nr:hypothetical protein [Gammaproteobacteria bacterium]
MFSYHSINVAAAAAASGSNPVRAQYMQRAPRYTVNNMAAASSSSQPLVHVNSESEENTQAKKAKLTHHPKHYSFLSFMTEINLGYEKALEEKAEYIARMEYLESIMEVDGYDGKFQCNVDYKSTFLSFELIADDEVDNKYFLYIDENNKRLLSINIILDGQPSIMVTQRKPSRLTESDIMSWVDGINLLFNAPITFRLLTQPVVAQRSHIFTLDEFVQYMPANVIVNNMSRRALQIMQASVFKNNSHKFQLSWKNAENLTIDLSCDFYLRPYSHRDKHDLITSWVHDEKGMLADYKIDVGSRVHHGDYDNLEYYWLKVSVNNFEILKLWVSLDAAIGELRDLRAPDKKYGLNGATILKIYEYLQTHFLKINRTYLCDASGLEYSYEDDEYTIPYRIIYPLVYQGHSYYSKYLPGFRPLSCKDVINHEFNEIISSNPDAFDMAAAELKTLPLIKLFESFDILGSEYRTYQSNSDSFGGLSDEIKNENKKNDILFDLVSRHYPLTSSNSSSSSSSAESSSLALAYYENDDYNNQLKKITLGSFVKKIWDEAKQYAPQFSKDLILLNELLKFPDDTVDYNQSYVDTYGDSSYYGLLNTLLSNGRYWVRMKDSAQRSAISSLMNDATVATTYHSSSSYQPGMFRAAASSSNTSEPTFGNNSNVR